MSPTPLAPKNPSASLFSLLKPYRGWIILLLVLTVGANALNLAVPKIMAQAIDSFTAGHFVLMSVIVVFSLVGVVIFILAYLQSVTQTYVAERVARDLRTAIADKISRQEYASIQQITPAKLLTNLTSDVDAVKNFVSQAIASIVSSIFLIFGTSILLLLIDWQLGLLVLLVVPLIGGTFYVVFSKVRVLFRQVQETIDWLNKIINESILGAALIRLLNSSAVEYDKFLAANTKARDIGLNILRLFAKLIPVITLATNLATLVILTLGGHFVIVGKMSLGNFTAFNSYLAILIFPILIIGFMSNIIAQATSSYQRIRVVLDAPDKKPTGSLQTPLTGKIAIQDLNQVYAEHSILKNITLTIEPGTRTAIIGPTAAGKTQLLYLLTGLLQPTSGTVAFNDHAIGEYDPIWFHNQVGFVFQDSIIFNASLKENIAFNTAVTEENMLKAITAAELGDFLSGLPDKINTMVSERGTSLSGGQKQRIMLARALALNPKILFLDDFTARVDAPTEQKILGNIQEMYPGLTLISVTQKIAPIVDYDQIILLMEGEILACGRHQELMATAPEYAQIFHSQRSTSSYELHA